MFTLRVTSTTEARMAQEVERILTAPAWESPNRVEAQLVARMLARKVVALALAELARQAPRSMRQVAPATFEL